jgi:hypothetical protein
MLPEKLRMPPSSMKLRSHLFYTCPGQMVVTVHLSPPDRIQLHFYLPATTEGSKPLKFAYIPIRLAHVDEATVPDLLIPEMLGIFIEPSHRQKSLSNKLLDVYNAFVFHFITASLSERESLWQRVPQAKRVIGTCEIKKVLIARLLAKTGWKRTEEQGGTAVKVVPRAAAAAAAGGEQEQDAGMISITSESGGLNIPHSKLKVQNARIVAYEAEHADLENVYIDAVWFKSFEDVFDECREWVKTDKAREGGLFGWEEFPEEPAEKQKKKTTGSPGRYQWVDGSLRDEPEPRKKAPPTAASCEVCGSKAELKCGGCHCVYYCTKQCQLQAWKGGHKALCGKSNATPAALGPRVRAATELPPKKQIKAFKRLIEENPGHCDLWHNLSRAYGLAALNDRDMLELSIKAAEEAVTLAEGGGVSTNSRRLQRSCSGRLSDAHFDLGSWYLRSKDYVGAVEKFRKSLDVLLGLGNIDLKTTGCIHGLHKIHTIIASSLISHCLSDANLDGVESATHVSVHPAKLATRENVKRFRDARAHALAGIAAIPPHAKPMEASYSHYQLGEVLKHHAEIGGLDNVTYDDAVRAYAGGLAVCPQDEVTMGEMMEILDARDAMEGKMDKWRYYFRDMGIDIRNPYPDE